MLRRAWSVLGETFEEWRQDNVSRLAASLAFYATFSLAPALVIALAIAGAVVGSLEAKIELVDKVRDYVGLEATSFLLQILDSSQERLTGHAATLIGVGASLFGATVVFAELRSALNLIWKTESAPGFFLAQILYDRLVSFAVVLAIGLFLVASMFISAASAAVDAFFSGRAPIPHFLLSGWELLVSFLMMTLLVAAVFKLLPDRKIAWGDVWVGAVVTSVLLTIGKYGIGMYIGRSSLSSLYGAAGSFVIILVWIYYNAHVFFFGAELAFVCALRRAVAAEAEPVPQAPPVQQTDAGIRTDPVRQAGPATSEQANN